MSDSFTDLAKVTRSHIPTTNTPTRIDVPRVYHNTAWEGRIIPEGGAAATSTWPDTLAGSQSSAPTLKHGRSPGSKDSQPRKRKMAQTSDPSLNLTIACSYVPTYEVILDYGDALDKITRSPKNREISVHYVVLDEVWNRNKMIVDDAFAYTVATDIMLGDDIQNK
ncbi:hypothetical protein ACFX2C_046601 [Malus domestica]